MLFLDEVLDVSGSKVRTRTVLREDFILAKDGKVSPLVAIELFAQAAAAYMASRTSPTDRPTVQGALLGSRTMDCFVDSLSVGDELIAEAEQVFGAGALAQFKCALFRDGEKIAEGNINVVSGSDVVRG
jgi:predicted hotdog family 3-hydroxylacyl-ACP dehydratase